MLPRRLVAMPAPDQETAQNGGRARRGRLAGVAPASPKIAQWHLLDGSLRQDRSRNARAKVRSIARRSKASDAARCGPGPASPSNARASVLPDVSDQYTLTLMTLQ